MSNVTDLYMVTQFIQRLMLPFEEWPAFKLGIINEKGEILKKITSLKTSDEKNAWGHFDVLVCNIKRLLGKIPGGPSKLGVIAATVLLLKENDIDFDDMTYLEEQLIDTMREIDSDPGIMKMVDSRIQKFSRVSLQEVWTAERPARCDHCEKDTIHTGEMVERTPTHWEHVRSCTVCGKDPNRRRHLRNQSISEDAAVNAVGGGHIAAVGVGPDGEPGMGKSAHKKYLAKNKSKKLDTVSLLTRSG